jgi:hypothetical protein
MKDEYEPYFTAVEWCLELSRLNPTHVVIHTILNRLQTLKDKQKVAALKEHLAREYVIDHKIYEARSVLQELVQLDPANPMSYASLALHYLNCEDNPRMALNTILKAEEAACKSNNFRRHVQAEKARIALELDDYEILASALEKITLISIEPGQRDVRKERDFFDKANKSRLDGKIIDDFEKFWKLTK